MDLAIGRVLKLPASPSRTVALGAVLDGGDVWMERLLRSWRDPEDGALDCMREIGRRADDEQLKALVRIASWRAFDTALLKKHLGL